MTDFHQQMADLGAQIARLEARLGEVYSEFVELSTPLIPFLVRYQTEVLRHHRALVIAQREVADARAALGDSSALGPGGAHSPLDDLLERRPPTVEEQYARASRGDDGFNPCEQPDLPPASPTVRRLYARVVAQVHPALAASSQERKRRAGLINQINAAYLYRDEVALQAAADAYAGPSHLPMVVDKKAVQAMRSRAFDLEELIIRLEGQCYDLRHGDVARLHAFACDAEANGQDLLADLSQQLQRELERTTTELAELRSRMGWE